MLGLAGVPFLILGGMCVWGFLVALNTAPDNPLRIAPWKFGIGAILGIMVGITILRLGWRMALQADMSEPYSSEKPKVRF